MRAFEADGIPHRTRRLHAYDQFRLMRAVAPVLPALMALDLASGAINAGTVMGSLAGVEPTVITAAFEAAASAAEREVNGVWVPATKALPLPDMLVLVLAVVDVNLSAYLARNRPEFRPTPVRGGDFKPVSLPDDEAWFWRPILRDKIPAIGAVDYLHDLWLFAKVNDALDVQDENEARAMKAAEGKG